MKTIRCGCSVESCKQEMIIGEDGVSVGNGIEYNSMSITNKNRAELVKAVQDSCFPKLLPDIDDAVYIDEAKETMRSHRHYEEGIEQLKELNNELAEILEILKDELKSIGLKMPDTSRYGSRIISDEEAKELMRQAKIKEINKYLSEVTIALKELIEKEE